MTRTAFYRKSREYRESVGLEGGPWEAATEEGEEGEEGKIKAPTAVGRMWLVGERFFGTSDQWLAGSFRQCAMTSKLPEPAASESSGQVP